MWTSVVFIFTAQFSRGSGRKNTTAISRPICLDILCSLALLFTYSHFFSPNGVPREQLQSAKHLLKRELKGKENTQNASVRIFVVTENDRAKHYLDHERLMQANPMFAAGFCFQQRLQHSLVIVNDMITFFTCEAVLNIFPNTAGEPSDCYGHAVSESSSHPHKCEDGTWHTLTMLPGSCKIDLMRFPCINAEAVLYKASV